MHKYEEGKCIGRGSYGSAHLVTERASGHRYVIKKIPMELLNDTEKQQSFREVELLAKLKHPNVVEYKESFVDENVIHIVMAYCDGGDLAGRIKERAAIAANGGHGYFDTRQILDWFVQMAMAIKYLHEQRILHRDLKASNIFLTTTNVIKLGDFGIAKTLDSTLDQAKTMVGTPYYMSPEVCESKPYSYSSDVWSLGCVFYEMVALKHAFDGPNILTLILKIVQNDFAAVPAHYDTEISDILKRLLDKRPEHRPTMDQIFLMPYVRNHMQALAESGGSLKMNAVARRPHGTPKRRTHASKNGRRSSSDTNSGKGARRSQGTPTRWAAITPNDREDVMMGEGSDLELLDASTSMESSSLDLRLPERSKTPEPLMAGPSEEMLAPPPPPPPFCPAAVRPSPTGVVRKKAAAPLQQQKHERVAWMEQPPSATAAPVATPATRRPSADEIEEELDTRFQAEAAEALMMNINFQRVYAEECDDSLTVKYAPHLKSGRARPQVPPPPPPPRGGGRSSSNGKPPKPEMAAPAYAPRRRIVDLSLDQSTRSQRAGGRRIRPGAGYSDDAHSQQQQQQWRMAHAVPLTLSLSLDEPTMSVRDRLELESTSTEDPATTTTTTTTTLSDSGMLRQLEMEEASSSDGDDNDDNDDDDDDDDAYTSNSDGYEGEENFYSEHSAYSDDSDFAGDDENDGEYSDDFEEVDGEVFEYANDEFAPEDDHAFSADDQQKTAAAAVAMSLSGTGGGGGGSGIRSPKIASSPGARRPPPREVQWVMRNVAQSLMESCDNLSVA